MAAHWNSRRLLVGIRLFQGRPSRRLKRFVASPFWASLVLADRRLHRGALCRLQCNTSPKAINKYYWDGQINTTPKPSPLSGRRWSTRSRQSKDWLMMECCGRVKRSASSIGDLPLNNRKRHISPDAEKCNLLTQPTAVLTAEKLRRNTNDDGRPVGFHCQSLYRAKQRGPRQRSEMLLLQRHPTPRRCAATL
jgi:hypothetical protein